MVDFAYVPSRFFSPLAGILPGIFSFFPFELFCAKSGPRGTTAISPPFWAPRSGACGGPTKSAPIVRPPRPSANSCDQPTWTGENNVNVLESGRESTERVFSKTLSVHFPPGGARGSRGSPGFPDKQRERMRSNCACPATVHAQQLCTRSNCARAAKYKARRQQRPPPNVDRPGCSRGRAEGAAKTVFSMENVEFWWTIKYTSFVLWKRRRSRRRRVQRGGAIPRVQFSR